MYCNKQIAPISRQKKTRNIHFSKNSRRQQEADAWLDAPIVEARKAAVDVDTSFAIGFSARAQPGNTKLTNENDEWLSTPALHDTVEDHCTEQDSESCENSLTDIGVLKCF